MHKLIPAEKLIAVILTWNEEENISRTLEKLNWLEKIIVVDSGSTDQTIELIRSYRNTHLFSRQFDTHATQWNFGANLCESEWILSLDADYILIDQFIEEIQQKILSETASAFYCNFEFVVFGKALRGNNTTPRAVLFKKADCNYYDDGHTQRLHINGKAESFQHKILHDDRKPLSRWLLNQGNYSLKESIMLLQKANSDLPLTGRIRKKKILAPAFIFFYCLIRKGMLFNGWRGWHYTLQRTLVEILISLRLTEAQHLENNKPG